MLAAVRRELEAMPPVLRDGTHAAIAQALARELDDPDNSATSKSMCAARLHEVIERLRDLAPPAKETTGVDDIAAARAQRRAGRTAAKAR